LIFKIETAHKSSTVSGNLVSIERKSLLLCHFDRYLSKIGKVSGAAKRSSAHTDSAEKLCLISYTYLSEFDPRFEYRGKVSYELAEVNSARCGKIEEKLCVVK
jgi:hypothetical protein